MVLVKNIFFAKLKILVVFSTFWISELNYTTQIINPHISILYSKFLKLLINLKNFNHTIIFKMFFLCFILKYNFLAIIFIHNILATSPCLKSDLMINRAIIFMLIQRNYKIQKEFKEVEIKLLVQLLAKV